MACSEVQAVRVSRWLMVEQYYGTSCKTVRHTYETLFQRSLDQATTCLPHKVKKLRASLALKPSVDTVYQAGSRLSGAILNGNSGHKIRSLHFTASYIPLTK